MKIINDGKVEIENTHMEYVAFGKGNKTLVLVPGLGDGMKTVKGAGLLLSRIYKKFANDFRVFVFSRRNVLPKDFSTRDMAHDLNFAFEKLGLSDIYLLGVSQGGMISQFYSIDFPAKVKKLIIAVSLSRQNPTSKKVIGSWIRMIKNEEFKKLAIDTMEKTYVGKKLKKMRFTYPLMGFLGKPKSAERFLIQAKACFNHDSHDELVKIKTPTLVVGGLKDMIVGGTASKEIAKAIPDSKLIEYPNLGHGASDEKIFIQDALNFFNND